MGGEYLVTRVGRPEAKTEADEPSEALGALPLALEQAAAYCEHVEISFAEYQRRFQSAPVTLLEN